MDSSDIWPPKLEIDEVAGADVPSATSDLLQATDAWLNARANQFDPFNWQTTDERYARRKSFAEAAIYLYVADSHGDSHVAPDLATVLLDRIARPEYADLVRRYPRHFLLFSSPIVYALSVGGLTAGLASAVEDVLSGKTVWATERPAHRMMDLWNFCAATGKDCLYEPVDHLLRLGTATLAIDPIEANLRDAYALTHNLMFLYNFGVAVGEVPAQPLEAGDIGQKLESVLVPVTLRFLAEDNLDVALELVMVAALQRRLPRALASLVIGRVLSATREHGNVPGPKQDENHRLDVDDPEFQAWYADYHTMLVAASTFRILVRDWDVIDERLESEWAPRWDPVIAQRAGECLNRLHRYELPLGIAQLAEIMEAGSPDLTVITVAAARQFLSSQCSADGTFGLFPDERHAHERLVQSGSSFNAELGDAVSAMVQGFLSAA